MVPQVDDSHDPGGVIDFELVVFVLQQILQAAADVFLLNRKHDDFVVDEQAPLHGFRERQNAPHSLPYSDSSSIEQSATLSFSALILAPSP